MTAISGFKSGPEQNGERLCAPCEVEQTFTDRICHPVTSMLSLEAILAAGHCARCGCAMPRNGDCAS